jgi:hypothetical protein
MNNWESLLSVLNVRPSPKPGGQTVAFADVRLGPVTIHGFSVVKNRNGHGYFVGLPVRFGSNGKAFSLVELDEPVRSQIMKLIMDAARPILDELEK